MGAGASAGKTTPPLLDHCRQLFQQYDGDRTDCLDWNEFWNVLNDLKLGLTDNDIAEWQRYADADNSGTVRWGEFEPMAGEVFKTYYQGRAGQGDDWVTKKDVSGRAYRLNQATGDSKWVKRASPIVSHMKQLFIKHDTDSSGSLSLDEFWYVLSELNLGISETQILDWQKFADSDGSGTIQWDEFEPMADAMVKQFFSADAAGLEADPWLIMTDPAGQSYKLNRITGEQEWFKVKESKDIDFSRFENDAAQSFKLSSSPSLQSFVINEFHKVSGKDKVLEWEEFWRFMHNLDIGLTDQDIGKFGSFMFVL
jgi:Ca2+-binding EF-hand superfamily protein